ncbi:MAG: hypothetical protein JWO63_1214 [Frankiales bacterium]|nr:hypothetical protein [Frankiales bacterium]
MPPPDVRHVRRMSALDPDMSVRPPLLRRGTGDTDKGQTPPLREGSSRRSALKRVHQRIPSRQTSGPTQQRPAPHDPPHPVIHRRLDRTLAEHLPNRAPLLPSLDGVTARVLEPHAIDRAEDLAFVLELGQLAEALVDLQERADQRGQGGKEGHHAATVRPEHYGANR